MIVVVTLDVTGVGTSVELTCAVLAIDPLSISACVIVYSPLRIHVAPGARVAQVRLEGVVNGSETTTLVKVTLPVLVAVMR